MRGWDRIYSLSFAIRSYDIILSGKYGIMVCASSTVQTSSYIRSAVQLGYCRWEMSSLDGL